MSFPTCSVALAALAAGSCVHGRSGADGSLPTGAGGPAAEVDLVPASEGADTYGVPLPDVPGDPLRDAIRDDVHRAAVAEKAPPPLPDARLDRVAEDLARALAGDDLPPAEAVDFLINHHGMTEPAPHLLLARAGPAADLALRTEVAGQLASALRGGAAARVGVGVDRGATELRVVVALQERAVDLKPIPRRLPSGGRAAVVGRLVSGHIDPHLVVTAPDGSVRDIDITGGADSFRGELRCAEGDGRYQVEVTGADPSGSAVVANFPVYCGAAPPTRLRLRGGIARTSSPAEAEQALLRLVNDDRAAAGLPSCAWDDKLGEIARAHSRDMADHDFVGHVSPRTGNAFDRVQRAGLRPATVMENVGRAYSAEEAERGFMSSPGHRANLVDKRARRIGIGVVTGAAAGSATPLYVTQLFSD